MSRTSKANRQSDDEEKGSLVKSVQNMLNDSRLLRIVAMTGVSFGSFSVIHAGTSYLWRNGYIVDRRRLSSMRLSSSDWIYLSERIPSSIHAALSAAIAYYINVYDDKFFTTGNIWKSFPLKELDRLCCLCLGYALYDMITMYMQGSDPSMWVHHVVAAIGFTTAMWYRRSGIVSRLLMTEVTVITTNILWYITKFKGKRSKAYRVAYLMKTISFILCRVGVAPWLIYRAFREGQWETFKGMSLDAQIITASILIVFTVLNVYWTGKLCISAAKLTSRPLIVDRQ